MRTKQEMMDEMLFEAVKENNVEEVRGLIALGANVNENSGLCYSTFNQTPLHWSCLIVNRNDAHITKMLVEAGADVNAKDSDGWTPLYWAISEEKVDNAKILIEVGADVNSKSIDGNSPLREAIFQGNVKLVSLLIKHGADVNSQDNNGNTLLHNIISDIVVDIYMPKDILNMLIKAGANLQSKNFKNETPLEFLKRLVGEDERFRNGTVMKSCKKLKKILEKAIHESEMKSKAEEEKHEELLKNRILAEMKVALGN